MKSKVPAVAILLSILSLAVSSSTLAAEAGTSSFPVASGMSDQTAMAVTVYNNNLGMVKDRREIRFPVGTGEVRFMDVAAQILPASVLIKPLPESRTFRVLEQNYEYDLLNAQKLMDKYLGKEVRLYQKNPFTEREEIVTATLVANNNGPIFRIGNDITFNHPGRILFPGLPEGLIPKPTLVWLVENGGTTPREVETSYLTNGINWRADYVATLNENDDRADLTGWVTIDNRSGATYRNARLKLVAGDVNRIREEPQYRDLRVGMARTEIAPAQFKEEGFFEYHLYTLQRPSTIKDNQTKQINLVTAEGVAVRKELLFKGAGSYYHGPYQDGGEKQKVGVYVEMENRQAHNLGVPLPKGIIRVYKRDGDGSLQFIGEDAIDHTAKDERIRIKLGEAFDVVGVRKQTDWKKVAADTYEAAFQVTLRNHKQEEVTVKVVEPIPGDWQMLNSSLPFTKSEAFAAEFQVPIGKDGEATLSYRVRMRY